VDGRKPLACEARALAETSTVKESCRKSKKALDKVVSQWYLPDAALTITKDYCCSCGERALVRRMAKMFGQLRARLERLASCVGSLAYLF
jgi:NAD(P)H-flavin reductase